MSTLSTVRGIFFTKCAVACGIVPYRDTPARLRRFGNGGKISLASGRSLAALHRRSTSPNPRPAQTSA